MNMISSLLFAHRLIPLGLMVAVGSAVEQPGSLPMPAQHVIEIYQATIEKVVAHARQDIAKQRDQVIADLQEEKKRQTEHGDLPAAMAIKAKIEALASGRDLEALLDPQSNLLVGSANEAFADERNIQRRTVAEACALHLPDMTNAEWDALGGLSFGLDAQSQSGLVDTRIQMKTGDVVLVVPNPTDKWRCGTSPTDNAPMNYLGDIAKDPHGTIRWGCLYVQLGQSILPVGLVSGAGRLLLKCNDGTTADNSGVIRVKILKVSP
jgi:hypothetical protein